MRITWSSENKIKELVGWDKDQGDHLLIALTCKTDLGKINLLSIKKDPDDGEMQKLKRLLSPWPSALSHRGSRRNRLELAGSGTGQPRSSSQSHRLHQMHAVIMQCFFAWKLRMKLVKVFVWP